MVTLRQLRYLVALAEHRHFRRAAKACAVTQPALSMQVRELETALGIELVERRPGDVVLTDIGAEIVRRAESLLSAERDLVDFARHRRGLLSGALTLGVIPTIAPYLLPKILPLLQRRYPDLRVELRETQTKMLLSELGRGALDVILLALPVDEADVETLALFNDPFLLAVPASDARLGSGPVSAHDFDQEKLILLEEGHCLRDQALAYCGTHRNGSAVGLGATSLTTVLQMVANGFGVTLVPQVAVDVEVRDGRIRLLRFEAPQPGRTVGLAWRHTSPRKADFVALGNLIRETVGATPAGEPGSAAEPAASSKPMVARQRAGPKKNGRALTAQA